MTYLGFHAVFLLPPLTVLGCLLWVDARRRGLPRGWLTAVVAHAAMAVVYTTPWDNYLVARGVWVYDPTRIAGVLLGWVPLEEYVFFVLHSLLTTAWLLWVAPRLPPPRPVCPLRTKVLVAATALLWAACLVPLGAGVSPLTYLSLTLVWALPPLTLQLWVGADLLWAHRTTVAAGVLPPALYLSAADLTAIRWGIWTISPWHTIGWKLPGGLPVEEGLFFLATNTLLVFGMVLALDPRTRLRLAGGG